MSHHHRALTCPAPDLDWVEGEPQSRQYHDIYFAPGQGPDESRFVFLDGVGGETIWREKATTVIGETGFGTGLNFLVTAQRFLDTAPPSHQLDFVSAECFPLRAPDLGRALSRFSGFDAIKTELLAAYPPPAPGFHPLSLAGGRIRLLLLFGEATTMFADLHGQVDAWYLDGFSPAENPDMWSAALCQTLAEKSAPGARLATFTAAGHVRRKLEAAGFVVEKTPGFGRKRERITARYVSNGPASPEPRWWHVPPTIRGPVAIVGGGISGCMLADQCQMRGLDHKVFDAPKPQTSPASHVPAAVIAPRFQLDANAPASALLTSAYIAAVNTPAYRQHRHEPYGLRLAGKDAKETERLARLVDACAWGDDWIKQHGDSVWLPQSGSYDSRAILHALAAPTPANIQDIERSRDHWWLHAKDGTRHGPYGHVVFTQGAAPSLSPALDLAVRRQWGQTAYATYAGTPEAWSGGGYISAAQADKNGLRVIGSTRSNQALSDFDPEALLRRFPRPVRKGLRLEPDTPYFTGVRANTADHLPLMGPLLDETALAEVYADFAYDRTRHPNTAPPWAPGLWALGGMGSKGFQFAPLFAATLAAMIAGAPLPVPTQALAYMHPSRFAVRALIRS